MYSRILNSRPGPRLRIGILGGCSTEMWRFYGCTLYDVPVAVIALDGSFCLHYCSGSHQPS